MLIDELKVLIVEDEFISASFLEDILLELSLKNIFIATNAKDAIEVIREQRIDFIFMDINIDGSIDGIECAKKVNFYYDIPIIYITAYDDTQTLEEASYTNVFGYLRKPFDKKDIEISVKMLLPKLNRNFDKIDKGHILKLNIDYSYNFETSELLYMQKRVELSKKESSFLRLLIENINTNVSYELIRQAVWSGDTYISDSAIRDTVLRVRKKTIGLLIESNIGLGYLLKTDI